MSLKLVQSWITGAFRGLPSTQDALKLFEQAAAGGVDATLIAAPELTNSGKCCLAHWTGQELVVLELSPDQQQAFGIKPGTMVQELALESEPRELPPIRHINLLEVQIDDRLRHDPRKPLTGEFTFETNDTTRNPAFRCALRVKFYHPRMMRRITAYSHCELVLPRGEIRFSFDPLVSAHNPDAVAGPYVLLIQLVAAQNWTVITTCQQISNVLVRLIEVV